MPERHPTMSIILTPRVREVMHRFFDVYYEQAIEEGKRHTDEEEYIRMTRVRDLEVSYDVCLPHHEEDCSYLEEGEPHVLEEHECDCDDTYEFIASIHYRPEKHNNRLFLSNYTFFDTSKKEKLFEWLEKLPETYKLCYCGQHLEAKEGWCHMCYIHRYERPDEACCICMENEGRWVKLGCGHAIHRHCWGNLCTSSSCPLCRTPIVMSEVVFDPFNL